jgi:CRP-like cAMP-binding protein
VLALSEDRSDTFQRRTGITKRDQEILVRLPLFTGLQPAVLRALLVDAWVQSFSRNAALFFQDEPATRFYVVFDGWVKLFRTSEEGDESVISIFGRGESFAEAVIFDGGRYPVSAVAVDESRLLVVPGKSFVRQLCGHGEYALNIMASMSRHLHFLVHQVEQLTLKSSTERVAGFLVKLCPKLTGAAVVRLPLDKALIAVVRLPLDKALIAGRLGMQPETLSRSLAKLRRLGVESKGAEVSIPDVSALKQLSDGHHGRPPRMGC